MGADIDALRLARAKTRRMDSKIAFGALQRLFGINKSRLSKLTTLKENMRRAG
jgi:hypothetical protein